MGRPSYVRVLVGVVGVGGLVVAATACGPSADDDKKPETRSFSLPGRTLVVDTQYSALDIVSRDGLEPGKVSVTRWFKGSVAVGKTPKVTWEMHGNRLELRLRCAGLVANCAARHRVEVPRGVTVTVESRNGNVKAEGFKDALTVRTHYSSVRVTKASGPLTLDAGNGSVEADVASRRVRADVHFGSVKLRLNAQPTSVRTSSRYGSTLIEVPKDAYRVTTECVNGQVNVSVPRDDRSARTIDASSKYGGITVRTRK